MIYNNLILNKNINSQLKKIIETNSVPNALLFYGNQGAGKIAHAIEFSASLLCNNPYNHLACSDCPSCNKIKKSQHENINFVVPYAKKKSSNKTIDNDELNNIKKILYKKASNPYFDISNKKAQSIPINAIREIRKSISLSSFNNYWRIHIIIDAEKLCYPRQEAGNALLKMLEEPHEKNLFILCSSNISQILDTISSRCLKLYFTNLSTSDISNYLIKECDLSSTKAEIISCISNGNMVLANKLLNNHEIIIKDFLNAVNIIIRNNINEWMNFVSKFPNKNYNFILLLELLDLFFSDIFIYEKTQNKNKIKLKLFIDNIHAYINKYKNTDWNKCIDIIINCKSNINKNAMLNFTATSLLIELNKVLVNDNFLINDLQNYQV